MTPTEVFEMRYPWLVESYGLVPGSGGAGKFRGGLGTTKTVTCLNPELTVSFFGDRQKRGPWGIEGGKEGGKASIEYKNAASAEWQPMHKGFGKVSPSKFAGVKVRQGDKIRITTHGSGGWGKPAERDPQLVARDLAEVFVEGSPSV